MATLTKRQKQMVDYLENYIGEHGYAPTLAEVGEFFGLSSLATVHKHLRNLELKGFIRRMHNHSRALEIADRGAASPGETVVALIGDEATVKRYYPEANGQIRLQPANPAMEPIYVSEDQLRIR